LPKDEGRPAGGATLLRVRVGEERAFLREAIDVGRAVTHDAVVVGAEVVDTDVVAPNDQNVGFRAFWHAFLPMFSERFFCARDLFPGGCDLCGYLIFERTGAENHARDREEADCKEQQRGHQRQGERKHALRVHQPVRLHPFPLLAEPDHENDVIPDADDEHRDAEQHERDAEVVGGLAALQHAGLVRLLEDLEDREAEADQRQRRPDHRHQRPVRAHARALKRHSGPARRELDRYAVGTGRRGHPFAGIASH
jgi:hypothetical protein